MTKKYEFDLQLFADGGDAGGTAGEGVAPAESAIPAAGERTSKKNPLADVQYGIDPNEANKPDENVDGPKEQPQTETSQTVPDKKSFEDIRKEYEKDINDYVEKTVLKRLGQAKNAETNLKKHQPLLDLLATKYGADATDVDSLMKSLEEDDSFYEQAAIKEGLSVPQYKEFIKQKAINEQQNRELEEVRNRQQFDEMARQWVIESDQMKAIYPEFDIRTASQNPNFMELLVDGNKPLSALAQEAASVREMFPEFNLMSELESDTFRKVYQSGVPMRAAYTAAHDLEMLNRVSTQAAQQAETKIANAIAANGTRPVENGMSATVPQVRKTDPTKLTKEDREEIRKRVARGETVIF